MIALIGHSRRAAVAGGGAASSVLGNVGGLNSRAYQYKTSKREPECTHGVHGDTG